MSGKWDKVNWIKTLGMRIRYGVEAELAELCQLPNVGGARAKRLKDKGIKTISDILCYSASDLAVIMKCSSKLASEALDAASLIDLKASI